MKEYVNEILTFEKTDDYSGSFIEERNIRVEGVEDEDITASFVAHSRVNGTWEVMVGDLYLKYQLSTLRVSVDGESAKFNYASPIYEMKKYSYWAATLRNPEIDFVEALRKDVYSSLFDDYQEITREDLPFTDLSINENIMTMKTGDSEIMTYQRMQ